MIVELRGVTVQRGARTVLRGLDLALAPGWKVAVVGRNGAGKSTLLELIGGRLSPEAGELRCPRGTTVALLEQHAPAGSQAAIEYVLDGDRELRALEGELAGAEAAGDGSRIGALHARLEAIGGYGARARAARTMRGLGLEASDEGRPLSAFSGGQRRRLALARALVARAELLALDEPTNHLDLDAVLWLESFLAALPATVLVVSHDREFLDGIADHVAHVEGAGVRLYPGNYSAFERIRSEELRRARVCHRRQQALVARLEEFVARHRARAAHARQAQSRLRALERMRRVAPAHADSPFTFTFLEPARLPRPLLRLERAAAGYRGVAVIEALSLSLAPGDRIALLGANGAGKTTVMRLLAGELEPLAGRREAAARLEIGYFAQHLVERLDPAASPLAHLRRIDPGAGEQALRDWLGGFGFSGPRALEPVAPLSGGEKARLALALLARSAPNLLLLDEPTNHLDLEMRHALELALQAFSGAVVLVSHDRHLVRAVADRLWLVAGGRLEPWAGDLDEYGRWLRERRLPGERAERAGDPRRERRREGAARRRSIAPLARRVRDLEAELERLQARLAELHATLAEPDLYAPGGDRERLAALAGEQRALERRRARLEQQWLAASEALEAAAAGSPVGW